MRRFGAATAIIAILTAGAASWPVRAQEDTLRTAVDDALAADAAEDDFLSAEELDELVAPVALYPDALLAQVLVAATYPLQVVQADRLREASEGLPEEELAAKLEGEDWDPSVLVLLSGFPTVLERMADELDWTKELGDAMLNQDDEVLEAVQRKRAEAKAVGNLATNEAQVVDETDGEIAIEPADPEVVYVPTYDPQTVYTTAPTQAPYVAPRSTAGDLVANPVVAGAVAFGAALLVQELFGDDDDDNHDGWDDYWRGPRPIDWNDRDVYARPHWHDDESRRPWSWERDRYWDPDDRRWERTGRDARRDYEDGRRDTLGWLLVTDPDTREQRVRAFRHEREWTEADERARRAAERAAAERRQARIEAERREDRRARAAEEARQDRLAAERRAARERAEAEAERKRAAARARERNSPDAALRRQAERAQELDKLQGKAREEAQARARAKAKADAAAAAKAEADRARAHGNPDVALRQQAERAQAADTARKAKAQADAKAAAAARAQHAKAQADAKAKADATERARQAKAQADAKAKAQADAKAKADAAERARRAKAQADAKAKAQADAKAKAAADAKAKAQADAKARAQADARAKAQADAQAKAAAQARAKAQAQDAARAERQRAQAEQKARAQQAAQEKAQAKKKAAKRCPQNAKNCDN